MADVICKSKQTAIQILSTIIEGMRPGTQRIALESVAGFITERACDIPEDFEERRTLAAEMRREVLETESTEKLWAELLRRGEIKAIPAGPGKHTKPSALPAPEKATKP